MILSPLCGSLPLCLCVKILLSQSSRDAKTQSLPHAVRHLILSHLCASVPLCLCVNFITETQRHRDTEFSSSSSAPLLLCPSSLKLFHRRVEIHFLILSILLILSKKRDSVPLCLCASVLILSQRHRVFFILLCSFAPLR